MTALARRPAAGAMFVPNLQWLDADDPEAGRKARAHRQKEFHRAKRWKQTQQFRGERETTKKWPGIEGEANSPPLLKAKGPKMGTKPDIPLHFKQFDPTTLKYTKRDGEEVLPGMDPRSNEGPREGDGRRYKAEKVQSGKQELDDAVVDQHSQRTNAIKRQLQDQPWSMLASFRQDPFAMLPGVLNDRDNRLVDYYLNDYPRLVYNVSDSMIHKDVWFPLAKSGPIAFQAMAIYESARLIARTIGQMETPETIQLKQKTIRAIQQHLDSRVISVRTNDEIMAAILSIAHSENHFGLKDIAATHLQAVMAMVRKRGGPHVIDQNHQLGMFANWVNYLTVSPPTLNLLHQWSFHPTNLSTSANSAYTDLQDLLSFLRRTESLVNSFYHTSKRDQIRHRSLFNAHSPIYKICRLPPFYDQWSKNLIPVYTRVASLLHIHAALYEYRDKPEAMSRYLDRMQKASDACAYDTSCSIGLFVHYLLKIDYDECDRLDALSATSQTSASKLLLTNILISEPTEKRSWYTARILRVAKLMGRDNLENFHSQLLDFLDPSTNASMGYTDRVSEEPSETGSQDGDMRDSWIERIRLEILSKHGGLEVPGSLGTPNSTSSSATTPDESSGGSPDIWIV